jgi:hypothetical protein
VSGVTTASLADFDDDCTSSVPPLGTIISVVSLSNGPELPSAPRMLMPTA